MAKNKDDIAPEPWERQQGESAKAFEAFCIYRDMGYERAQRKVAKELGKSNALISRWSSKYEWTKRCAAWDTEQDRLNRIQQQKDIAKMRKTHAAIASSMLVKAAQALQKMQPEDIKPQDVARMVDIASKLERISRGDVGEVVEERKGEDAPPPVQFYMPENNRD